MSIQSPNWSRLRFALGFAQMAGATLAVVLFASEGLTTLTMYAAALTTLITVTSILMFGGQTPRR